MALGDKLVNLDDLKVVGDAVGNLKSAFEPVESAVSYKQTVNTTTLGTGFLTSAGIYASSSSWKITVLPVTPGEIYNITAYFNAISASQTAKSMYSVLDTEATAQNYTTIDASHVLAVGGTHGNTYGAITDGNQTETGIVIPADAVCMLVMCTNLNTTIKPSVTKNVYISSTQLASDVDGIDAFADEIANGVSITWNADTVLATDGTVFSYSNYSASDFIPLTDVVKNASFDNLRQKLTSTIAPICFYDKDKTFIGYYSVPVNEPNKPADVAIHVNIKDVLSTYTGAEYIRIGKLTADTVTVHAQTVNNDYPSHKMAMFRKAIFVGDSVTAGFVVEGTENAPAIVDEGGTQTTNPNAVYKVVADYSSPSQFQRIFPGMEITNSSQTGISVNEYYSTLYENVDFSEYDLIVIELGYNPHTTDEGYLNMTKLSQSGTNAYNYDVMAQAIRAQNPDAVIVLVRSSDASNTVNWPPVLYTIAQHCNGIVIDLTDNTYLDLQDNKYHGYYKNTASSTTASIDKAHFTRLGYNAKAYVIARLIADEVFN